jgi:hypothetical protein
MRDTEKDDGPESTASPEAGYVTGQTVHVNGGAFPA